MLFAQTQCMQVTANVADNKQPHNASGFHASLIRHSLTALDTLPTLN